MIASPPTARPPAAAAPSEPWLTGSRGALVFAGLFLAVLMGSMDSLIVSTALSTIASDLNDASGITFVVSAYLIATTIAIPIFARLSDTAGRRNVFLVGIAIFVVGSALSGLSQNLTELIAFRAAQGFGGGAVLPVAVSLIAVHYAPRARARMTGLISAAAGIAIVLGPLLGSYIVSTTTWRWIFYINLPIGIAAALILLVAVPETPPTSRPPFDILGTITLSAWVTTLMIALVQVADSGWAWTDPWVIGLLASSVLLFGAWLAWELRVPEPLVPIRLFGQRLIAASSGLMFLNGIVLTSLITFLSLFVGIGVLGLGAASVRDIIYFVAIPLVVGAMVSGWVLERVAYRTLVAAGLLVAGVAGLFLGNLSPSTPLWTLSFGFLPTGGLAAPLIPLGLGTGIALSTITIAVQHEAPRSEVGAAIGLTRFFQSLGGAVGLSLLTIFQAWRFGALSAGATTPGQIASASASSFGDIFLILAVLLLVSLGFALFLRGRLPRAEEHVEERRGGASEAERVLAEAAVGESLVP